MTSTDLFSQFNVMHWIVQSIAMLVTALLLPGLRVSGPIPAFFTVVVLAFINANIWDAALFFQIPNHISMQVLTLLVANAFIFWLVVKILPGIEISGIIAPVLAPILFTLLSIGIDQLEKEVDWKKVFESSKETVNEVKEFVNKKEPEAK